MENFRSLRKRITSVLSWRSESKKKKDIIKNIKIEIEKAEAEKLYWLMNLCFEFAENIQENLQISTENPLILNDAKFWIETQVQMVATSQSTFAWNFLAFKCLHSLYLGKSLRSLTYCRKKLAELVHSTNRKFTEFRCSRPQAYLPSLPYFNGDFLILSRSPFLPYFHTFLPYF